MPRSYGGPGRYIQGEISRLGEHLSLLGTTPFFFIDGFLFERLKGVIGDSLGTGLSASFNEFGGGCSERESLA